MVGAGVIEVPAWLDGAFGNGAALAVSLSGGKDSQTVLAVLSELRHARQWNGPFLALYADLGRSAWPGTLEHVQAMCDRYGVSLRIVRRRQGDLIDLIRSRRAAVAEAKPFWPSASVRYCTSFMKRDILSQALRGIGPGVVVSAEGLRAQEGYRRQHLAVLSIRRQITAGPLQELAPEEAVRRVGAGQRVGLTWYPIHDWAVDDVWRACGTSARERDALREMAVDGRREEALQHWPCHPCYIIGPTGNERSSCILCILGSLNDLRNGAFENPDHYREMVAEEIIGGWSFREGLWLGDVAPELLGQEMRDELDICKVEARSRAWVREASRVGGFQPVLFEDSAVLDRPACG